MWTHKDAVILESESESVLNCDVYSLSVTFVERYKQNINTVNLINSDSTPLYLLHFKKEAGMIFKLFNMSLFSSYLKELLSTNT